MFVAFALNVDCFILIAEFSIIFTENLNQSKHKVTTTILISEYVRAETQNYKQILSPFFKRRLVPWKYLNRAHKTK